jgi:hypothetical protein
MLSRTLEANELDLMSKLGHLAGTGSTTNQRQTANQWRSQNLSKYRAEYDTKNLYD